MLPISLARAASRHSLTTLAPRPQPSEEVATASLDWDYGLPPEAAQPVDETPTKAQRPHRFLPVAIDDVSLSAEPAWAIHRLLPARGLACIVGPPKSGKSFLASDALFSIARGAPYAGRTVLQGPVIYLTGEGVSGFKRRMAFDHSSAADA